MGLGRRHSPGDRGISPLVGTVTLLAIVFLALGALLAFGGSGASDARDALTEQGAQNELDTIQTEFQPLIDGTTRQTRVPLDLNNVGTGTTFTANGSQGNITIEVNGTEVASSTLGTISYENKRSLIGYQGGGIFQTAKNGGGAGLLASPPMTYTNYSAPTLDITVVNITGSTAPRGTLYAERTDIRTLHSPPSIGTDGTVTVTINSEFARSWERHFIENIGLDESDVTVSNDGTTVTAQYTAPHAGRAFARISEVRITVSS